MKGDGTGALWEAWRKACLACEHADPRLGCVRLGVVEYTSGRKAGFPLAPGGCSAWAPRLPEST